jgi:hypothetical protein
MRDDTAPGPSTKASAPRLQPPRPVDQGAKMRGASGHGTRTVFV